MSSSNAKVPTKTATGSLTQKTQSKPAATNNTKKVGNPLTAKISKNSEMNACHDVLQSIQHEYEQFEVNMDEKD